MNERGRLLKDSSIYRGIALIAICFLLLAILLPAAVASRSQANQILGIFVDSGQMLGENGENAVAMGDLDGDKDLDGVLSGQVWLNDGAGVLTQKAQDPGLDAYKVEIALSDVDGDEDLDLIAAMNGPNEIWLNNGSAAFSNSGQTLGDTMSWAVAVGDVDDDKDPDILFASDGGHKLYLNNGSGVFTVSTQDLGGSGVRAVALEDVDGDEDLDAFFADCSTYLNNGSGEFTYKEGSPCNPADPVTMDMGDIDGDDDIDAVIGNATKDANIVMVNDGDGNFSNSGQTLGASSTEQVTLSDVDLDGDLDLFTANTTEAGGDPADKVWTNDGKGVFSDSGQALGVTESFGVVLGDVDGDGDPDALVGAGRQTPDNKLYFNGMAAVYMPVVLSKG
jgi:hypothetical protein